MDWLVRSISAKLSRAEYHFAKLARIEEGGAVTDLLKTRTDRDRDGRVRVRVKEIGQIPDEWHVWIGECVHDMRSALDHLAYGLNIIGSRQDPPPNHSASQFPIYSEQLAYRTGRTKSGRSVRPAEPLIAHFPRGARTRVERLQPYTGRKNDKVGARRLSDLADLSNIDKHRKFPITATALYRLMLPNYIEGHRVTFHTTQYRLLKLDTTIIWLEAPSLPRSVKEPQVDLKFSAQIELEGKSANPPVRLLRPSEPVVFTLEAILIFILERVLPEFERWAPGLSSISRSHA